MLQKNTQSDYQIEIECFAYYLLNSKKLAVGLRIVR